MSNLVFIAGLEGMMRSSYLDDIVTERRDRQY